MRALPGRAAFVGRAGELGSLVGLCRSGPGGVALLIGEAGSGKSRLLSEVAARAGAAGAVVMRGHAVPGGGAFRPLAEALVRVASPDVAADDRLARFRSVLARILPGWPTGLAAGSHVVDPVVVLGEAVLELLMVISQGRRCVVVLDDLQWADRERRCCWSIWPQRCGGRPCEYGCGARRRGAARRVAGPGASPRGAGGATATVDRR